MENKALEIFKFEEKQIRTNIDQNGVMWFVAKDACEILQLQTAKAVKRLNVDDVNSIHITDSSGRLQATTIINESGLYSLVLKSRKPQAERFQRWVTSDVLPTIRKTGRYSVRNEGQKIITTSLEDIGIIMQNIVMPMVTTMHNNTLEALDKVISVDFAKKSVVAKVNTPASQQIPLFENKIDETTNTQALTSELISISEFATKHKLSIGEFNQKVRTKISKRAKREKIYHISKTVSINQYPENWLASIYKEEMK